MFRKRTELGISKLSYHVLSKEDYLIFTHAIVEEFKEIATVQWHFTIADTHNQDEFAIKYFDYCIDQTALSPKVKGQLKQKA